MRFAPRASVVLVALVVAVLGPASFAQVPPGYYDSVDTTNAGTLRQTLHAVIDDHTRFPYTASSTDTWDILELAQQNPASSSQIVDVYRNRSFPKQGGGNSLYNREHSWPKSYGFPNDASTNYPYTDCHQLFLCDDGYNTARSNKPFRNCSSSCTEEPTDANNGQGGGSGSYPGNSNWTSGSFTQGTWEVWRGRRGDIARAQFYLDVRYEGGTHGVTGAPEPDLILTDVESLIDASNTGNNESVAYMGMLSVLLQWHLEDPVDDFERQKNDVVYGFQGNRNPFVDHPEWVDCLFNGNCSPGGPPINVTCTGDVNGEAACPCLNFGLPGNGCDNAQGTGGVNLDAAGDPALNNVVLVGTGFPISGTPSVVVIRSPNEQSPPVAFGDGLRCISTSGLVRFGATAATSGGSTHPVAHGAGPGTFYYQLWYRSSPAAFCDPGAAFNLSNGLSIAWP